MTITATPKSIRPHLTVVEVQDKESGYRFWSVPMKSSLEVNNYIAERERDGHVFSDSDCSGKCWCITE